MPIDSQPQSTAPAPRGAVEPGDFNVKGIVYFVVGLVVALVVCHFILLALFKHYQNRAAENDRRIRNSEVVASAKVGRPYFPSPHEQFSPQLDLQALKAEQERELNSYGWVDRGAGVVRMPIERAMELVLQRGLPTRVATNAAKAGVSSLELQQQRPVQSSPPGKGEGK